MRDPGSIRWHGRSGLPPQKATQARRGWHGRRLHRAHLVAHHPKPDWHRCWLRGGARFSFLAGSPPWTGGSIATAVRAPRALSLRHPWAVPPGGHPFARASGRFEARALCPLPPFAGAWRLISGAGLQKSTGLRRHSPRPGAPPLAAAEGCLRSAAYWPATVAGDLGALPPRRPGKGTRRRSGGARVACAVWGRARADDLDAAVAACDSARVACGRRQARRRSHFSCFRTAMDLA